MGFARISGTGSYLPPTVLTNEEIASRIDTTDEWILQRVGIKERRVIADNQSLVDMMEIASLAAMKSAGIEASDIDLIIVGTVTADHVFPSAACLLQRALGVNNQSPAFDLNAACAGFIYALNVADNFLQTDEVKTALVVGADAFSRIVNWEDRSTCVLFGDGAGAVVLQSSDQPGVLATQLHAQGEHADLLYVENSVWDDFTPKYVHMRGKEVFRYATEKLGDLVGQLLAKCNLEQSDIDWLIPHQANKRIIAAVARKLNLSEEKIIQTIEHHGNTSSASVPLALDHAVKGGLIQRGDVLMLEAFGGGFAWGAALVKY